MDKFKEVRAAPDQQDMPAKTQIELLANHGPHQCFLLFTISLSHTHNSQPCTHAHANTHTLPLSLSPSQKLNTLRGEVDVAVARADAADTEVKKLTEELSQRDHEIVSLKARLQRAEEDLEKADVRMAAAKVDLDEGENTKTVGETLMRKVSLLETELDSAESNLRETTEKYVFYFFVFLHCFHFFLGFWQR